MNSLIRWSATLGLVGSTVLAMGFGQIAKVLALPTDDVVKILQGVPVFTIADAQGAPLVALADGNKKVTGIFMSQKEAQAFFDQLKKQKPDVASKVMVQPVSLGEVYKLALASANKPDGLNFAYVPVALEVETAKKIAGQQFQGGVPIFVARGGKDQGYLTIQQNNEQVIPFFFEEKQIQEMVNRFKKDKPDLAATVKIDVVPLENVISTLQQSNDTMLTKIRFVPSQESLAFIRSVLNQSKGQAAPANNQPAPKK